MTPAKAREISSMHGVRRAQANMMTDIASRPAHTVFPNLTPSARAMALSRIYDGLNAEEMLAEALLGNLRGRIAMVSSFGAESVALLHLVAQVDPATPVLFIDTQLLFAETLTYQTDVATQLGLSDVRVIRATDAAMALGDPQDDLRLRDTDACCDLRKTQPLENALDGFDGWITGRKRFQSGTRATLPRFETDAAGRLKLNPLADWGPDAVRDYMVRHELPPHPLVAQGYPSIGCAPCTSKVAPGEDPRSGRWRGEAKTECGIHFVNGKMVRG